MIANPAAERIAAAVAEMRAELDRIDALRLTEYSDRDRAERIAERIAETAATIAGGQYRPEYQGWRNRASWAIALHLDNDQDLHRAIRATIAAAQASDPEYPDYAAAEATREYVEAMIAAAVDPISAPPAGSTRRLCRSLVDDLTPDGWTDWRAVAAHVSAD